MVTKEIIKRNFSRCAPHYDAYSAVQDRSALALIGGLGVNKAASILDIGCGTGGYTGLLRRRFPHAGITAVDISPGMIEAAKAKFKDKKIEFITADAEKISFVKKFDLITSNSSFQWFEDLEKALVKYRALLNENGTLSFSAFGPKTFFELSEAFSRNFADKNKIKEILKKYFRRSEVKDLTFKRKYASLHELLRSIKYTGTQGYGRIRGFWTPNIIGRIEKKYIERFGDISATYEVFICKGKA